MQPISRTHIILTILALVAIAYLIVFRTKDNAPGTVPVDQTPVVTETNPWPSVEVRKETVTENNQYYEIEASYPVTADTRITDQFKTFITGQIAQFKDDTSWVMDPAIDSASSGSLSLNIDYREERSAFADNYVFSIVTYTGGAHGLQVTRTFAFDKSGKVISVADLFTNGESGLKTIASVVQKELTRKKVSDAEWIADGAAATAQNYQSFVVGDGGLTFIFDPYQVAPYASGTQSIFVPLSAFKGIANPQVFTQ